MNLFSKLSFNLTFSKNIKLLNHMIFQKKHATKFIIFMSSFFIFLSCGSSKKVNTSASKRPTVAVKPAKKPQVSKPQTSTNKPSRTEDLNATSTIKATPENVMEYINAFKPVVQNNMRQYNIPASIIMAQGILESGIGKGKLAREANNHFGIKCHKEWQGDVIYHDDDNAGECFRKYTDASESYRDYALFLTSRSRYNALFNLEKNDYKGWATGLKNAGYATDPKYPDKLIGLIERYELFKLDDEVLGITYSKPISKPEKSPSKPKTPISEKSEISPNLDYHIVEAGETLFSISKKYQIDIDVLKNMNQLLDNSISIGQKLLLKSPTTETLENIVSPEEETMVFHEVIRGDTLFNISKRYNLTVDRIKTLNNLTENTISLGQKLRIK